MELSVFYELETSDPSPQTVRRNYPLVRLSQNRFGVTVGYLRNRQKKAEKTAA